MSDCQEVNHTCILLEISSPVSISLQRPSSDPDPGSEEDQSPMISDEIRLQLEIVVQITLFTATSVVGVLSNSLNLLVYWRQGLKDSISVGLFALSLSDFLVVFLPLFTSACYIADHLYPNSSIQFKALGGVSSTQARQLFYSLSCSLTAFLSIERCLCIIRPFKVKLIFTRRRTIIIVISLFWFYVLGFVPIFSVQNLRWQRVPWRNFSRTLTLWNHPAYISVEAYHNSVMTIFIPTTAQVIVTCTAVIMIKGLHAASRFRQIATGGAHRDTATPAAAGNTSALKDDDTERPPGSKDKDKGDNVVLDSRDARLVKTMIILVSILSIANVPYIALEYTQLIVPEMNPLMRYQNTFRLISSLNFLLGSINASVNAFVYYYTGSNYRKIVNELLWCRK